MKLEVQKRRELAAKEVKIKAELAEKKKLEEAAEQKRLKEEVAAA